MTIRVTFTGADGDRTVEFDPAVPTGSRHGRAGSLLDIALHAGIHLEHVCGGSCACTTCQVYVRSGMEHLSPMEEDEADRLDGAWDLRPTSRLACQAVVLGDVECEIPASTRNYVEEGGGITLGRAPAAGRRG